MSTIKVVIADSHPVFREGLAAAISDRAQMRVVGTFGEGPTVIREVRALRPDVLIVDLQLPGLDGVAVLRSVHADGLPTRSLAISTNFSRPAVYDAVSAGAHGYISKKLDSDAICEAILEVAQDRNVWPPEMQEALANEIRGRNDHDNHTLSPREVEILKLVADGQNTAGIANSLFLSQATVKTHLQRSFGKLGVKDRAAAVAEALRRGYFD